MTNRRAFIGGCLAAGLCPGLALAEPGRSDAAMAGDWPWTGRYAADNARLLAEGGWIEAVFIGDSITEHWPRVRTGFFAKDWANRGISGQTSPQILLRMMTDVIALRPKRVHILAGTNDVAENTGPIAPQATADNLVAMALLARDSGIDPVIGTIPPASRFYWKPAIEPAARVIEVNRLLRLAAKAKRLRVIDYHAAMADAQGGLPKSLGDDGVHPNAAGYAVMERLLSSKVSGFRTRTSL